MFKFMPPFKIFIYQKNECEKQSHQNKLSRQFVILPLNSA